jgi:hypothetical protein
MLRTIARLLPAPCLFGADLRSRLIQTTSRRSGTRGRRITAPLYPRGSRIKFLRADFVGHAGEEILKRLAGLSRRATTRVPFVTVRSTSVSSPSLTLMAKGLA